jgi:hypothetical protein
VVIRSSIFWDVTQCSPLKVNRRVGRTCRLHLQGRRISQARNQSESRWQAEVVPCLDYSSTLKMEVTCSSETSVFFQWNTRRYVPKDRTLRINCFSPYLLLKSGCCPYVSAFFLTECVQLYKIITTEVFATQNKAKPDRGNKRPQLGGCQAYDRSIWLLLWPMLCNIRNDLLFKARTDRGLVYTVHIYNYKYCL